MICYQYEEINQFYFLIKGTLKFSLAIDQPKDEVVIGKTKNRFTPIGWGGFNRPQRHASTVKVCSQEATLLTWKISELMVHLEEDIRFMKFVVDQAFKMLEDSTIRHGKFAFGVPHQSDLPRFYELTTMVTPSEVMRLFRQSPFLGTLGTNNLKKLSQNVEKRYYEANEVIYSQGSNSDGIYILIQGQVILSRVENDKDFYPFRSISTPGFMVGWTSLLESGNIVQATTKTESTLYFIKQESINELCRNDRNFEKKLNYRLLWLLGNQLQVSRARLIQQKTDKDVVAVQNLIDHNRTKFSLISEIHKVPHLLKHKDTIGLGLKILHVLNEKGDTYEKHISSVCLDLISPLKREHQFYDSLQKVYSTTTEAPKDRTAEKLRIECSIKVNEALKWVDLKIEGQENLPETPGHIFVYNHILNHPHYTLPNNFQITLDSHFISSAILLKKYGDPGLRIVRIGKGPEYAHQEYYKRLGHINVYTKDSDVFRTEKEEMDKKRHSFYLEASKYLNEGKNIIISPEGVSNPTEESPGELKAGAFKLALKTDPEPQIVPISLAYFDRRITETTFGCTIEKPFKMSDFISDPSSKDELKVFLNSFQKEFALQVQGTIERVKG